MQIMSSCVRDINIWMASNYLKLNMDKTEILIVQSIHNLRRYGTFPLTINSTVVQPSSDVSNLGVTFDQHLDMTGQVANIVKACNYQLWRIGRIRKYISHATCQSLIHQLVTSRLDYASTLLPVDS